MAMPKWSAIPDKSDAEWAAIAWRFRVDAVGPMPTQEEVRNLLDDYPGGDDDLRDWLAQQRVWDYCC